MSTYARAYAPHFFHLATVLAYARAVAQRKQGESEAQRGRAAAHAPCAWGCRGEERHRKRGLRTHHQPFNLRISLTRGSSMLLPTTRLRTLTHLRPLLTHTLPMTRLNLPLSWEVVTLAHLLTNK